MMYKKTTTLTNEFIDQIRINQKVVIMDEIHNSVNRPKIRINLRSRKLLLVNTMLVVIVAILAIVLTSSPGTEVPTITFQEVYAELVSFQENLESFIPEDHTPAETYQSSVMNLSRVNPDYTRTYEQLREIYVDNVIPIDEYTHLEYVLIASEYYDIVVDVLGMYEYIPLFKWVDGVNSDYIDRLKILVHDNEHFTLSTMKEYENYEEYNVFYIGFDEDGLFEIEHIRYYGDINITGSDTDFNFFRIKEDTEAVWIQTQNDSTSINHTSFTTGQQTLVYKNNEEMVEGVSEDVYYASFYDEEHNIHKSVGFTDTNIHEESYWQYNDLGLVFGYYDRDVTDNQVRLHFNLLEAPGWDYASYNPQTTEEQGVYIDDVKLFEEHSTYVSKQYLSVNVSVRMNVQNDEITNSLLNLSQYGLYFYEGTITEQYLDQIRVQDIIELKNEIEYNEMDFEQLTDRELLYNGLRSILKNSILVVNDDEE